MVLSLSEDVIDQLWIVFDLHDLFFNYDIENNNTIVQLKVYFKMVKETLETNNTNVVHETR